MARSNGIYDTMTFEPYVFQEYPKWITLNSGQKVLVEGRSEELRAIANDSSDTPVTALEAAEAQLSSAEAEIARLRAQLEGVGTKRETKAQPEGALASGSVVGGMTATPKAKATTPQTPTPAPTSNS